jgi:hypothetical protein
MFAMGWRRRGGWVLETWIVGIQLLLKCNLKLTFHVSLSSFIKTVAIFNNQAILMLADLQAFWPAAG